MTPEEHILAPHKPALWEKFRTLLSRPAPRVANLPPSPQEALRLGFRLGLQAGYGEGLVDGVDLGLDVKITDEDEGPVGNDV